MPRFNDSVLQSQLVGLKGRNEGLQFIAQSTLTGSVTSVTFSSIPQVFTHLRLICSVQSDRTGAELDGMDIRFNGDTGANYDEQQLNVNNATVSSVARRAQTSMTIIETETDDSRATSFSPVEVVIPNYTAAIDKWALAWSSVGGNVSADGDLELRIASGRWRNTAAITSMVLFPVAGTNFLSGSKFALYGIR